MFGVLGGKEYVGYIQNGEGILMNKVYGLGGEVGGVGGSRLVQYHVNGSC